MRRGDSGWAEAIVPDNPESFDQQPKGEFLLLATRSRVTTNFDYLSARAIPRLKERGDVSAADGIEAMSLVAIGNFDFYQLGVQCLEQRLHWPLAPRAINHRQGLCSLYPMRAALSAAAPLGLPVACAAT